MRLLLRKALEYTQFNYDPLHFDSYLASMMQFGPGYFPTFLYYFTTTAVIFTLMASRGMGISMNSGLPQQLGLAVGVIAGLLGAYVNYTTMMSVQFQNRKKFLAELETALTEMGYQQTSEEEGVQVYERSAIRRLLSGKLYVQLENNTATIASRAANIRRLQKEIG
ncbi:MAG: hypothetical protein Kow00121_46810 [Elainellaceae cyanobacterium]